MGTLNVDRLWYARPAVDWSSEALPIGNGALGAMVFGTVERERVQLTEKSLWTGGPGSAGYDFGIAPQPLTAALATAQTEIDRTGRLDPQRAAELLGRARQGYGNQQPLGELVVEPLTPPGEVTGYERDLRLDEAVAGVAYRDASSAEHSRRYFASHPDGVLVGRWSSTGAAGVSVRITFESPHPDLDVTTLLDGLRIGGRLRDNGMRLGVELRVVVEGGTVRALDDGLVVENAASATVVLAAATDYTDEYPHYRGPDPGPAVAEQVAAAVARPYAELLERHRADHRLHYDRVRLDLDAAGPDRPTDQLLAAYGTGEPAVDRALESLIFRFGRYLLIASSRPGALPANLQGVWNAEMEPAWSSDYHVNINLQMNYWPAASTNLLDLAEPYLRFVEKLTVAGEAAADRTFATPGWVVHNETTPFGFTGVHDHPTSFWFPEANGWLASDLFDLYRFSCAPELLDRIYPVLRGAATFWLENLRVDPRDDLLVVNPSYSPEHGDFTAGAAMAQQIVSRLLSDTLEAAEALGADHELRERITAVAARLDHGLRIGPWGQLQEWKADLDDRTDQHRHVSHLYALFPGRRIRPGTDLAAAAATSLDARGDTAPGWARAWRIHLRARLLDGDRAHEVLAGLIRHTTLPNLFDVHPPFQVDGSFGATSGITEMLLQSHGGEIHVLPALPQAWGSGQVTGLLARGAVEVDIAWDGHEVTRLVLRPSRSGPLHLRSTIFLKPHDTTGSDGDAHVDGDRCVVHARAGHAVTVSGS